jgi:hypothetical protein
MLVLIVIDRENFDSSHFELFNFPGIKPCDVIMNKSIDRVFKRHWTTGPNSLIRQVPKAWFPFSRNGCKRYNLPLQSVKTMVCIVFACSTQNTIHKYFSPTGGLLLDTVSSVYRVYKKKVIELQRAIIRESLGVWTIGFHIRKDQAFSYWMACLVKIAYFHLCA